MRKSDFSKIFAIALMSASMLYVPKAEAMIPVIDGTSIANTIKDWMNNIKGNQTGYRYGGLCK